jgi:selenocysteine lyase/cysteine desulfurase
MAASEPGSGYFLYHSIGLYPDKARQVGQALAQVAQLWGTADDSQWPRSLERRQQFLARWQSLLNVPAGTLTTAENVTTAVYSVIGSLPQRQLQGRQLLIAADCFPSLHFLLAGMAQRRGFELVTVPLRPGEYWVRDEDLLARWTDEVGVAMLTWVTSTASHRCDLRRLLAHGRARGTLVGVDLTQGIGIIPWEALAPEADFLVASSLKWLCGVAGAGVLQVRPELLGQCQPELRGWFSQENPFSWNLDAFAYAPDARRFDHGTPSILAPAACLPALEWHARQDPIALLAHNRRLVETLSDGAQALGLEIASPRRAEERGGSLMLKLPPPCDPPTLLARLREHEVFADCRGTTLRLSPGNLTTDDGVARLLRALREALR